MEIVLKLAVPDRERMGLERLIRVYLLLIVSGMLFLSIQNYTKSMAVRLEGDVEGLRAEDGILKAVKADVEDMDASVRNLTASLLSENLLGRKTDMMESIAVADVEQMDKGGSVITKSKAVEEPKPIPTSESLYETAYGIEEENIVPVTIPTVSAACEEENDSRNLNENGMGVTELSGFLIDSDGFVTGVTDSVDVTDGVLVIPTDTGCVGIRKGVFSGLGNDVMEMYIPANIVEIEAGALDDLLFLLYIEVAEDNPYYESIDGILYSRSGEEIFCPMGR